MTRGKLRSNDRKREREVKTYRLCLFSGFCVLINEVAMSFHLNSNQIELCAMYRNTYWRCCCYSSCWCLGCCCPLQSIVMYIASLNAKNVNNKYTLVSYSHCILCVSRRIQTTQKMGRNQSNVEKGSRFQHSAFIEFLMFVWLRLRLL